jgi:hypothetical protein
MHRLVVVATGCAATSSPAFARLVGLDGEIALVVSLLSTLLVPFTAPPLALGLMGIDLAISVQGLMARLALIVGLPLLLSLLIRRLVAPTRLAAWSGRVDGMVVLLLVIYGIGVMDGMQAMLLAEPVWVAGVIADSRAQMTRRGMMRVVVIDDGSARLEVTVFQEAYEARRHVLKVDAPLLVQARIENDDYSGGLRAVASEFLTLTEARARFAHGVRLRLQMSALEISARSADLMNLLRAAASDDGCPMYLELIDGSAVCELALGDRWRVVPSEDSLQVLRGFAEGTEVNLVYAGYSSSSVLMTKRLSTTWD